MEYVLFLLLGLGVGTFGTLVGAGGGFILMPALLLLYPGEKPVHLTAISLAVVCMNAFSGTFQYSRMKRVDFRSGLMLLIAGVPGAVAGAFAVKFINRDSFNLAFGLLLLSGGLFLFYQSFRPLVRKHNPRANIHRKLIDVYGTPHEFSYDVWAGMAMSFTVGLISSMMGIGGGIILVPSMINLLNFPVHLATATSQFILAVMSLAGVVVHAVHGNLGSQQLPVVLALGVGAAVGAKLGAELSRRLHGKWIIRVLAIALAIVGARVLLLAVTKVCYGG